MTSDPLCTQKAPCRAAIVLLATHARDVPAGEVLPREPLEERRASRAPDQHEHIVAIRGQVRPPPGLHLEPVALPAKHDGVARGQVGVVEGEGLVGVVDFEDPVGARADVEHEHVIHAEEEIPEPRVAAAVLERKGVVYGDVAAVGSADVDAGSACCG